MAEKVTTMVLKVDLQCSHCYKKIKKVLCKFPQIRNQVYDEKGNTVTVTVVCCSPEKCRDKLCSKGGKVIKSIEIKEPAKPKAPAPEKPKEPEKSKEPDKKKEDEKPREPEKPSTPKVIVVDRPKKLEKPKVVVVELEKPKPDGGKPQEKPKEVPKASPPEQAAKPPAANPVTGIPPAMACYGPSYDGFGGVAPWYNGYGIPPPPQPRYDGYYGYEYGYPYGRASNFNRCDAYFSEENPSSCSIM